MNTQLREVLCEVLELEREAKSSYRFRPVDERETNIGTVYIRKSAFARALRIGDRVRIQVMAAVEDAIAVPVEDGVNTK